jgi:hypothetical protein
VSTSFNPTESISSFSAWTGLYKLGGAAALVLLAYALVTMTLLLTLGGYPATAEDAFRILRENRGLGLLRLDILTSAIMPFYYPLVLSIYMPLRRAAPALALLGAVLGFAGITLIVATPSALSMASLSDRFAAAGSEMQKTQLLAAGEAILASDLWHGTGAKIGGFLLQTALVLVSVTMLRHKAFSGSTAYVGISTHGLDLFHILAGFFSTKLGVILMAVAGPLYLFWFPLLARDLFRLGKTAKRDHRSAARSASG